MDYGAWSFILVGGGIILLIWVLSLWQVFNKAGEDGWKAVIPIYNAFVLTKIANQPIWVFFLLFVPFVNIIASILVALGVARVFDKTATFAIIGLFLFPYFGYMVLGWGQAKYTSLATATKQSED